MALVEKVILCYTVCVLAICQCTYSQRVYLVSIGIADYPGDNGDLRLSALDGKRIKWLYDKNSHSKALLLIDSLATKSQILAATQRMFTKAKPEDMIVFFSSGHGYNGAFCAYDADITYTEVRNVMAKSKSKHKMIFADACLSGNMRNEVKQSKNGIDTDMDVMLFLSSRDDEYSMESTGITNGYFTTALQLGLRSYADADRNRIITAKELFVYVSQMVKDLSRDQQHPVMWGHFSDDMPVMVW
ncbi:MAG: caspase family protein [Bacteroidaceae bacterium]|nr:caspase family protein [Bacteroidaceae bacterium]